MQLTEAETVLDTQWEHVQSKKEAVSKRVKIEPQLSPPSTPIKSIKREHSTPTHKNLRPPAATAKVKVEPHASSLLQPLILYDFN